MSEIRTGFPSRAKRTRPVLSARAAMAYSRVRKPPRRDRGISFAQRQATAIRNACGTLPVARASC